VNLANVSLRPDVLVVDEQMGDLGGMAVAAKLERAGIEVHVVAYKMSDGVRDVIRRLDIADCVLEDHSMQAFLTAIRGREIVAERGRTNRLSGSRAPSQDPCFIRESGECRWEMAGRR